MPRGRKKELIEENDVVSNEMDQEIVVPLLDTSGAVGLEVENNVKSFERPVKKFGVYFNNDFLEEVDENSDLINFYLDENKKELDKRIFEINKLIEDPNILIFFHEGKQNRSYMNFSAFYSQNGLAPKILKYDTWAKYYRSVNPLLSDEEIVLHKFGNLPYSFVIAEDQE